MVTEKWDKGGKFSCFCLAVSVNLRNFAPYMDIYPYG